jgi:hypothetical protein
LQTQKGRLSFACSIHFARCISRITTFPYKKTSAYVWPLLEIRVFSKKNVHVGMEENKTAAMLGALTFSVQRDLQQLDSVILAPLEPDAFFQEEHHRVQKAEKKLNSQPTTFKSPHSIHDRQYYAAPALVTNLDDGNFRVQADLIVPAWRKTPNCFFYYCVLRQHDSTERVAACVFGTATVSCASQLTLEHTGSCQILNPSDRSESSAIGIPTVHLDLLGETKHREQNAVVRVRIDTRLLHVTDVNSLVARMIAHWQVPPS